MRWAVNAAGDEAVFLPEHCGKGPNLISVSS